jgi:hypothetical protein
MSGRGCPLPVPDGRRFESLRRYYFGRGRYRLTAARIRWTVKSHEVGLALPISVAKTQWRPSAPRTLKLLQRRWLLIPGEFGVAEIWTDE